MKPPIPSNEAKRLTALHHYRILDTSAETAYDDITLMASSICQTPIALMSLVDSERQWFKARVGLDTPETPRDHSFCAHTILGNELLVVEDATVDERFASSPLVTSDPHIRFYAGAPLIDRKGNALGALCVIDRKPRQMSDQQKASLKALARSIIAHLELRRVSAELVDMLADLKTVRGLLPICSYCKGIRNDEGYWNKVVDYISAHSDVDLSHSVCPACLKTHHPDAYNKLRSEGKA